MVPEFEDHRLITKVAIATGIVNALAWILLGWWIISFSWSNNLIWWGLFCLILNIGISYRLSKQPSLSFRRPLWVIGITFFVTVLCATLLGGWTAYGVWVSEGVKEYEEWGGYAFWGGALQGGIIGIIIGVFAGIKTSPKNSSTQHLVEGIGISIVVGMTVSILSAFIFATVNGVQQYTDNYLRLNELGGFILVLTLLTSIYGAIPSIGTGLTTMLAIYVSKWWLKKRNAFQKNDLS